MEMSHEMRTHFNLEHVDNYFFKSIAKDVMLNIIDYIWNDYKRFKETFKLFHRLRLVNKLFRSYLKEFMIAHSVSTSIEYFKNTLDEPIFYGCLHYLLKEDIITSYNLITVKVPRMTTEMISISRMDPRFKSLNDHVWFVAPLALALFQPLVDDLFKTVCSTCESECLCKSTVRKKHAFWVHDTFIYNILGKKYRDDIRCGTIRINYRSNLSKESQDILNKIKSKVIKGTSQCKEGVLEIEVYRFVHIIQDINNEQGNKM